MTAKSRKNKPKVRKTEHKTMLSETQAHNTEVYREPIPLDHIRLCFWRLGQQGIKYVDASKAYKYIDTVSNIGSEEVRNEYDKGFLKSIRRDNFYLYVMEDIIKSIDGSGIEYVKVKDILDYTVKMRANPPRVKVLNNEFTAKCWKHQSGYNNEMFKSVIGYGQSALKCGLLLHGTSAVALLTFLGILIKSAPQYVNGTLEAIMIFASGAGVMALCTFFTYLSQRGNSHDSILGKIFEICVFAGAIVAIGLYVLGVSTIKTTLYNSDILEVAGGHSKASEFSMNSMSDTNIVATE